MIAVVYVYLGTRTVRKETPKRNMDRSIEKRPDDFNISSVIGFGFFVFIYYVYG